MNRFLKSQLQDIEIPEEVYRMARDRAWLRLQRRSPAVRTVLPWAAAIAVAAVAGLFILRDRQTARMEQPRAAKIRTGSAETPMQRASGPQISNQVNQPVRQLHSRRASGKVAASMDGVKASDASKSEMPERVVMSFVLPETGVRLIWISDKNFKLDGVHE